MIKIPHLEWFKMGAILGLGLSVILFLVNKIIGSATYGIEFSVYSIRGSAGAFLNSGKAFTDWLFQLAGLQFNLPGILMTIVGLGLLVILARYVIGLLQWPQKADQKMMAVVALASVLQGLIMAGGFNAIVSKFSWEFVLFAGITGFILSFVVKEIYKKLRWSLPA